MTPFEEGRKAIGSQGYWFNTQRRTLWVLDTILWRKVTSYVNKGRLEHWLLNEVATICPKGAVQVAGNSWTSSRSVWRVKDPASPRRARFGSSKENTLGSEAR
ncbi:hypothetical protein M0804_002152 [Polistes exclamans]|nr:hypothetical protein M0804_002152 [Polistes exclamans]